MSKAWRTRKKRYGPSGTKRGLCKRYCRKPCSLNPRRRAGRRRRGRNSRGLSVPEKHQLRIARQTLKMSEVGARIMGGPTHAQARAIIARLTGRTPRRNPCRSRRTRRVGRRR